MRVYIYIYMHTYTYVSMYGIWRFKTCGYQANTILRMIGHQQTGHLRPQNENLSAQGMVSKKGFPKYRVSFQFTTKPSIDQNFICPQTCLISTTSERIVLSDNFSGKADNWMQLVND